VSAIPANTEWLEDGVTALLFDPGDARGLADAIRRAHDDRDLRAHAATANRARVVAKGDLAANMARMEHMLIQSAANAGC
jgi:glycosyltransferase involved in cell wall biosynthesis